MKLDTATLKLRPAPERGFLEMTLPQALNSFDLTIAGIPGVAFKRNVWLVPEELEPLVVELGLKTGLRPLRVYNPPVRANGPFNEKLHPYQQEAAARCIAEKSWLLNFEMGCVSGHAIVNVNQGGKGLSRSLSSFYTYWRMHGRHRPYGYVKIRALVAGELRLVPVVNVLFKGVKPVVVVSTAGHRFLRLTPDHEVLLSTNEWLPAGKLRPGDTIVANGRWTDKDGYIRVGGLKNKHSRWTTGGVYEHLLVAEKMLGRSLAKDERVHHKNGVKHDNRPENLEVLSHVEHMRHHGKTGGYRRLGGFVPEIDTVVSVRADCSEAVYDVVCPEPHNFVASGIVVHNCGKTPTAIETLRLAGVSSALIVCPALVRHNWLSELDRWWPAHWDAEIIDSGAKAAASQASIRIVSYELIGKLAKRADEAIVLDESHYIANMGAGRTRAVEHLARANPDALRLALTATPITNEPKGLHNQLDVLWPGRFGSWFQFVSRYCDKQEAIYSRSGFKPVGLNAAAAAELRMRLASCSSRVTKLEVAHLLPPFQVQCLRVPPRDRGFNPRELLERFVRMDKHNGNGDALIRAAGEQKVGHALEQVRLALTSGNPRVAVLTHLKSTAHEIAAVLQQEGVVVQHVDGDVPISRRIRLLKQAAELPTCVLVTTMHAVNVGIDLTPFNVAVFAELDYTPANVIQALGRFSRLSGKLPATCYLIVLAGTQDEIIAQRVQQKTRDINAVIAAGDSEKKVQEALDPKVEEAAFWEELREAASQQLEGDYV